MTSMAEELTYLRRRCADLEAENKRHRAVRTMRRRTPAEHATFIEQWIKDHPVRAQR